MNETCQRSSNFADFLHNLHKFFFLFHLEVVLLPPSLLLGNFSIDSNLGFFQSHVCSLRFLWLVYLYLVWKQITHCVATTLHTYS